MFTRVLAVAWVSLPGVALAANTAAEGEAHHGPPWGDIALHAFNLAVLLVVLYFLVGGRIRDALANRSADLKHKLAEAQQAEAEARARFEELERKLAGFEQELSTMRDDAEGDARRERDLLTARAEAQVEQISAATARSIRDETARARQTLRADAASLAVELASREVALEIGGDDHQRLTADFLSLLESETTNGVGHG